MQFTPNSVHFTPDGMQFTSNRVANPPFRHGCVGLRGLRGGGRNTHSAPSYTRGSFRPATPLTSTPSPTTSEPNDPHHFQVHSKARPKTAFAGLSRPPPPSPQGDGLLSSSPAGSKQVEFADGGLKGSTSARSYERSVYAPSARWVRLCHSPASSSPVT
jgi:hypothetical protein